MINNIWILIGKKLNGEASAEELQELEELLQQGVADQYPLDMLEQVWKNEHQTKTNDKLEAKWLAFEDQLDIAEQNEAEETAAVQQVASKQKRARIFRFISVGIAACLVIGFFWMRGDRAISTGKANEINAPKYGISKVQLPDGTKVWLNGSSKLTYGADYGSEFRKVYLTGEAFFDVVKDAKRPFIVTTPTISIKVLGTAFNVRAYNNDKTSEASLVRGRIELTVLKNPEKKIILKASEKLTVINNEQPAGKATAGSQTGSITQEEPLIALSRIHQARLDTLPSEALWIENKLAFDAEDFESIAVKLERRYNVHIDFKNEALKKMRFTGKFRNETIIAALQALQGTTYFHYKTNKQHILIY